MSSYSAIRGVTETLKSLLDNQMEMNGIAVSSAPPDLEPNAKAKRVNLFLYKVVENAYLKNQEIPGEGNPAAYGHPPLSLVLYYLLTAFPDIDTYNKDYDLSVHEILADAMRVFHDYPILTDSMEIPPGSGTKLLHTSLQNQFEQVKIVLAPLDTEELSKIWMGLTNPYRLSVGYTVSVVQIESQKPKRIARPVKMRRLHAILLRRPKISDIMVTPCGSVTEMPPATARIGDTLIINGSNFWGISTQLIIGDTEFDVIPQSNSQIEFVIPDAPKLQPGVLATGVRATIPTEVVKGGYHDRGVLESGENVTTSNQVALMLGPKISITNPSSGDYTEILTINGKRLYKESLKSYVLIGDISLEVDRLSVTNLEAARAGLEAGIQTAHSSASFAGAQVARIGNQLFILPGIVGETITFAASGGDPASGELRLGSTTQRQGVLSSDLSCFTGVTNDPAEILITIGGEGPHEVNLIGNPTDLETARAALENGIRGSHTSTTFTNTQVIIVGTSLLILPGNAGDTIIFTPSGGDPALNELGLDSSVQVQGVLSGDLSGFTGLTNDPARIGVTTGGDGPHEAIIKYPTSTSIQVPLSVLEGVEKKIYPIRIRVNGAESLEDDKTFELT